MRRRRHLLLLASFAYDTHMSLSHRGYRISMVWTDGLTGKSEQLGGLAHTIHSFLISMGMATAAVVVSSSLFAYHYHQYLQPEPFSTPQTCFPSFDFVILLFKSISNLSYELQARVRVHESTKFTIIASTLIR